MTDTTTEHAALIERLEAFHAPDYTPGAFAVKAQELIKEAATALRTSHSADAGSSAEDRLEEYRHMLTECGGWDLHGRSMLEAVGSFLSSEEIDLIHLRRNAPQEATDEA